MQWTIKMLYDGQCAVCAREVAMLRRRAAGRVAFEDISERSFDPTKYGLSITELIASMHGIKSDGTVIRGIDVFAEVYDAVGWHRLSRFLQWKPARPFVRFGYNIFARIRPWFSSFRAESCDARACPPKKI